MTRTNKSTAAAAAAPLVARLAALTHTAATDDCGCGTLASDPPAAPANTAEGARGTAWAGVICVEGEVTGDGRMIERNALAWADLPIPLRYVSHDTGGHENAIVVGSITAISRGDGGQVLAEGKFDTNGGPETQDAIRHVAEGVTTGVSVDLDDVSFEVRVASQLVEDADAAVGPAADGEADVMQRPEPDADGRVKVGEMKSGDEVMVTTSARIRAATIVAIPAFASARIAVTASAAAATEFNWVDDAGGLPQYIKRISDHLQRKGMSESHAIASAVNTVKRWCAGGGDVKADTQAEACAAVADWERKKAQSKVTAANATAFADQIPPEVADADDTDDAVCAFPDCPNPATEDEDVDGLGVVRLCKEHADLLEDTPEEDRADLLDDGEINDSTASAADSLAASAAPMHPPAEWFADPHLTGPSQITVTEDGRVYGHLAAWNVCHTGHRQCVTAPKSRSGYAYFHTGSVTTADGGNVPVGHLTIDTGHAGPSLGAGATLAHYDNTGTAVADVQAGEDEFGIWVAGALRPSVSPDDVRALRASPLSGDWRNIGGTLELVAALAVNVPGFPIPRPHGLVASGREVSLVATGVLYDADGMQAPATPSRAAHPATGLMQWVDTELEYQPDLREGLAYLSRLASADRKDTARDLNARVNSVMAERISRFAQKRGLVKNEEN